MRISYTDALKAVRGFAADERLSTLKERVFGMVTMMAHRDLAVDSARSCRPGKLPRPIGTNELNAAVNYCGPDGRSGPIELAVNRFAEAHVLSDENHERDFFRRIYNAFFLLWKMEDKRAERAKKEDKPSIPIGLSASDGTPYGVATLPDKDLEERITYDDVKVDRPVHQPIDRPDEPSAPAPEVVQSEEAPSSSSRRRRRKGRRGRKLKSS